VRCRKEIYYKGDKENEERERIERHVGMIRRGLWL